MNHYELTYWSEIHRAERFMIVRCKDVDRLILIFRSIFPLNDILSMRPLQ